MKKVVLMTMLLLVLLCGAAFARKCPECGAKLEGPDKSDEGYIAPTCEEYGYGSYVCTRCNFGDWLDIAPLDHDYKWVTTIEPTCYYEGEKEGTCKRCKDVITEAIPKIAHKYADWELLREPSCTRDGARHGTCVMCGKGTDQQLKKLDHDYRDWKISIEPTCRHEGEISGSCVMCGKTGTRAVPKIDHNYEETILTPATSSSKGRRSMTCSFCGKTYEEDYMPAGTLTRGDKGTGTWGDERFGVKKLQELLIDKGYLAGGADGNFGKKTEAAVSDFQKANDLNADGIAWPETIALLLCSAIDETLCADEAADGARPVAEIDDELLAALRDDGAADALADDFDIDIEAEDTLTLVSGESICFIGADGAIAVVTLRGEGSYVASKDKLTAVIGADSALVCEKCGHEVTPTLKWAKPGCKSSVKLGYKCPDCKKAMFEVRLPALGHSYGAWKVTKAATCKNKGERTHTCLICGKSSKETLPKHKHIYIDWVTTSGTRSDSRDVRKGFCAGCGAITTVERWPEGYFYNGMESGSNAVMEAQRKLKNLGHLTITPDGLFGNKTEQAVKAFEKANDLTVDGVLSPEDLTELDEIWYNNTGRTRTTGSCFEHSWQDGICTVCGMISCREHKYENDVCKVCGQKLDYEYCTRDAKNDALIHACSRHAALSEGVEDAFNEASTDAQRAACYDEAADRVRSAIDALVAAFRKELDSDAAAKLDRSLERMYSGMEARRAELEQEYPEMRFMADRGVYEELLDKCAELCRLSGIYDTLTGREPVAEAEAEEAEEASGGLIVGIINFVPIDE